MAQYGQEALAATLEQLSDLPFTITNFHLANDIVRYNHSDLSLYDHSHLFWRGRVSANNNLLHFTIRPVPRRALG